MRSCPRCSFTVALLPTLVVFVSCGHGDAFDADVSSHETDSLSVATTADSSSSDELSVEPDGDSQSAVPSASQWSEADLGCTPSNNPSVVPETAREYAALCGDHGLGVVPTVSCDEAVRVPTTVGGEEVFETVASCDHTSMLKPACVVGSKIGRVMGQDASGEPLPEVVWVYFCRAAAQTALSSVQMIGYHYTTGATCFFEANEGPNSILPELLGRDALNGLTGQMPSAEEPEFDRAFIPPPDQCVQCHQNNPFIRNPWLDGAVLPEDPSVPVLPTVGARSPYYVVGGAQWDMRTIHIDDNACLSCHRIGMEIDQIFAANGFDVNTYMPPSAPGTMADDYQALYECWQNGPESTPGCDWIIPPAADCEGGVVGADYPYAAVSFNRRSSDGGGEAELDFDANPCPEGVELGLPCTGDAFTTACLLGGQWYWCEGGAWQSK